MAEFEVPQAAVDAVLNHLWRGGTFAPDAHAAHNYYGGCAVCRGDVPAVLAVAAPYIAAAALRQAADAYVEAAGSDYSEYFVGQMIAAWLGRRADELDGRQPSPDIRELIVAIADEHAAHMREKGSRDG